MGAIIAVIIVIAAAIIARRVLVRVDLTRVRRHQRACILRVARARLSTDDQSLVATHSFREEKAAIRFQLAEREVEVHVIRKVEREFLRR